MLEDSSAEPAPSNNDLGSLEVPGDAPPPKDNPFSFNLEDYLSAVDDLQEPSKVIEGEAGSSKYDQYYPHDEAYYPPAPVHEGYYDDHYYDYQDPHHDGGCKCGGHGYDDYYNDCDSCMNACSLADIRIVKDNNNRRDLGVMEGREEMI